jgi:AcrR family transcriptional regulator
MVEVVSERGVGRATVSHVVARSGVSRRTFYELFDDRGDCFLAAFDEVVGRMASFVVPAYRRPGRWREQIRAGLSCLLEYLDREREAGRVVIVETLGAGPAALERRGQVLARLVEAVDAGADPTRRGEGPVPLTAEGVVGGALSLIHARLLDGKGERLTGLLNPLMSMIVLPYLGAAAARRELQQPIPHARDSHDATGKDPLRDLEMRLTYRTIRVLLAIGEMGGRGSHPSNRQVADAAGIRDQGQMSKLLARLQHLGLIENAGEAPAKGEPNKWTLTSRGSQVRQAVSVQSGP